MTNSFKPRPACARAAGLVLVIGLGILPGARAGRADGDSPYQVDARLKSPVMSLEEQREVASLRPPLLHLRVTSHFGERFNPVMRRTLMHRGVDYGAPSGTPVYAAQAGTITAIGMQAHAGVFVRIRHSRHVETLYAHLHRIMPGLKPGSVLRGGDILGFVGESGFATGPHLHYEILVGGAPVDPEAGIRKVGFP